MSAEANESNKEEAGPGCRVEQDEAKRQELTANGEKLKADGSGDGYGGMHDNLL